MPIVPVFPCCCCIVQYSSVPSCLFDRGTVEPLAAASDVSMGVRGRCDSLRFDGSGPAGRLDLV